MIKKKELNISAINLIVRDYVKNYKKLNLNDVMMDFDATSLFPSAMYNKKSVYLKIETGFAFKPRMNNIFVEAFNIQTYNQDGNESAILKKNDTIRLIWYFNIFLWRKK